jgi:hypothetical protein
MNKRTLIVFGLILVIFAGLLTRVALQPPAARPSATVAFIGYTNDTTGTRLAAFTVSNASPSAVRRLSHYRIQIPTSKRWTNISDGYISGGTAVLPPGGSETVTVVAPTNHALWRPWFVVSPGVGVVSDTMGAVADAAHAVGLRTRYRKRMYGADCDWIRE